MPSHLDIPRLPREPLLSGPPHTRGESIFTEAGIPEAMDLVGGTMRLNSAPRRQFLDRHFLNWTSEEIETTQLGLQKIADDAVEAAPSIRNESTRLLGFVAGKLAHARDKEAAAVAQQEANRTGSLIGADELFPLDSVDYASPITVGPADWDRDPVLRDSVSELVRFAGPDDARLMATGYRLFERFKGGATDREELVTRYLGVIYAINVAKIRATSFEAPARTANNIIAGAGIALADAIPTHSRAVDELHQTITAIAKRTEVDLGWVEPKANNLIAYLQAKVFAKDYAARFLGDRQRGVREPLNERADHYRQLSDELMQKLARLRQYGLKPAYFTPDTTLQDNGESWVVNARLEEIFDDEHTSFQPYDPFIAQVALTDSYRPENLRMKMTPKQGRLGSGQTFEFFETEYHKIMTLAITPDGTLCYGNFINLPRSIRPLFESNGLIGVYEAMRLQLCTSLFDLMVPVKYVNTAAPVPGTGEPSGSFEFNPDTLSEIALPRVKILRDHFAEIEKYLSGGTRNIRSHEVGPFPRDLPPGYKASAEARNLAAKYGVELLPNQTFVKKHRRGNPAVGEVKSHHATTSGRR